MNHPFGALRPFVNTKEPGRQTKDKSLCLGENGGHIKHRKLTKSKIQSSKQDKKPTEPHINNKITNKDVAKEAKRVKPANTNTCPQFT